MLKSTNKKESEALVENFKKKIENLIVQNIKDINLMNNKKSSQEYKVPPLD